MPATLYLHKEDPKQTLLDKIGDVSGIEVFHNQVLVAVYMAPQQMASGLWRSDANADEDRYQSKVGLILKAGPQAFKSTGGWEWPEDMAPGDWVYFRISDTLAVTLNGSRDNLCRIIDDADIRGRSQHPDQVW